jgi:hypothetical protein
MPVVRVAAMGSGLVLLAGLLGGHPAAKPSTAPSHADRDVTIDARIVSAGDRLYLTGSVDGSKDPVVLYRATTCEQLESGAVRCDYHRVRTVPQKDGSYRAELEVPEKTGLRHALFWQARVAGADTDVWRTYRLD